MRLRDEGGVTFGPVVGVIVIILAAIGAWVVCTEDENVDTDGLGRMQLVSHEYGDGCWEGECGGGGQSYEDQWSNEDRNRNRNRNRGAFSPGPFDDSPVDAFNGNTVCLPGSTCYADGRNRDQQPPNEREPQR